MQAKAGRPGTLAEFDAPPVRDVDRPRKPQGGKAACARRVPSRCAASPLPAFAHPRAAQPGSRAPMQRKRMTRFRLWHGRRPAGCMRPTRVSVRQRDRTKDRESKETFPEPLAFLLRARLRPAARWFNPLAQNEPSEQAAGCHLVSQVEAARLQRCENSERCSTGHNLAGRSEEPPLIHHPPRARRPLPHLRLLHLTVESSRPPRKTQAARRTDVRDGGKGRTRASAAACSTQTDPRLGILAFPCSPRTRGRLCSLAVWCSAPRQRQRPRRFPSLGWQSAGRSFSGP